VTVRKGCLKAKPGAEPNQGRTKRAKKTVAFSTVEVREHPRILGDNPSVKKGPALSLGWYIPDRCRTRRYGSIDEYEKSRPPRRRGHKGRGSSNSSRRPQKNKHHLVLSPSMRTRLLMREAGVTDAEIARMRREVAVIKQSRKQHNAFLQYGTDETAMVVEAVVDSLKRIFHTGTYRESELQSLMDQAERAAQRAAMTQVAALKQ
jgi:hypothetical protein